VIASIGAAFALSFDTVSQTALFSLTGAHFAGWPFSVGLGGVFTLGMMATDATNGLWVARMLQRADRRARMVSRAMCLAIALLGIAIAVLGIARLVSRDAAGALAGTELAMGMAVGVAVAASFWIAMQLARRKAA
jgi:high-affinity nickel-transport protein